MSEIEDTNKKTKGFVDPVVVTCTVERSLRDAIKEFCYEQDVTIHAFIRRALILMYRKCKGVK